MNEKDRWSETREALVGISKYALEQKSGEIDLKFLNSSEKTARIKVRINRNKILMPRFDDSRLGRGFDFDAFQRC